MTITNKQLLELFEENRQYKDVWLSDDLINVFVDIINNVITPKWFTQLTYRDDIKTYCLSRCMKGWHYFNKDKSNNPYAYLTTIIRSAAYHYVCTQQRDGKTNMPTMQKNTAAESYANAMKVIRS